MAGSKGRRRESSGIGTNSILTDKDLPHWNASVRLPQDPIGTKADPSRRSSSPESLREDVAHH
jgi:hypothetical protein